MEAVTRLLGRSPAGGFAVVVRRADGTPVVIRNDPFLDDGTPMPTRYWLVDPDVVQAVSRLEAEGGVKAAAASVDPEEVAIAHERYASQRDGAIDESHSGPRPSGGVGGTRQGVKCLHAHLAWWLAGGDDPVGRFAADRLGVERENFTPDTGAVAALDCGTNSTRLLVVDGGGRTLDRQMRITRLGQGVDADGVLAQDALERTLSVLADYRRTMDEFGVRRARLVATSAVRDAANGQEFLDAAAAVTGVTAELLSGTEEGRLSFAGATASLPPDYPSTDPVLVVDVGGGSTELVVGDRGHAASAQAVSVDFGCVRVTERWLAGDPPTEQQLEESRRAVRAQLDSAAATLPHPSPGGAMVGLAGTVSTLAALENSVSDYDRAALHHVWLSRQTVSRWLSLLASEPAAARSRRPGMVAGREDVIVGGILVVDEVMATFDRSSCLVSEDDILDGLALSLR